MEIDLVAMETLEVELCAQTHVEKIVQESV